jgi:hypothetical protein
MTSIKESTKRKMSMQKKGSNSPKFGGWFITPHGVFGSSKQAAIVDESYDNKILRYCRRGEKGWGFKAEAGREPQWYLDIVNRNIDLKTTQMFAGKVTRGKVKNYFLTPEGLFGCIITAAEHNGLDTIEVKKLCILGKKGFKLV